MFAAAVRFNGAGPCVHEQQKPPLDRNSLEHDADDVLENVLEGEPPETPIGDLGEQRDQPLRSTDDRTPVTLTFPSRL